MINYKVYTNLEENRKLINDYKDYKQNGYCCGIEPLDNIIRMDKSSLSLLVSTFGNGKSTFANYYSYLMAKKNGWKTQIISFETVAGSILNDIVNYYDNDYNEAFTHTFITEPESIKTIDDLYKCIEEVNKEYHTDMCVIDNFSNLDRYSAKLDTLTIGIILSNFQRLSKELNINLLVLVHAKEKDREGDIKAADIFGSSHFSYKADFILSIQANRQLNLAKFKSLKIRDNGFKGYMGYSCTLEFDRDLKAYKPTKKKFEPEEEDYSFEEKALNDSTTQQNETELSDKQEKLSDNEDANKSTVSNENKQDDN